MSKVSFNIDKAMSYRFVFFIQIYQLSQKDVDEYTQVIGVEKFRCLFGGEEHIENLEYQQFDAVVFRRVFWSLLGEWLAKS